MAQLSGFIPSHIPWLYHFIGFSQWNIRKHYTNKGHDMFVYLNFPHWLIIVFRSTRFACWNHNPYARARANYQTQEGQVFCSRSICCLGHHISHVTVPGCNPESIRSWHKVLQIFLGGSGWWTNTWILATHMGHPDAVHDFWFQPDLVLVIKDI